MNIYLARHGTTEWNSLRKIQGRTDIMLDETGKEMARQTGIRLKDMGITFDHVFSSPLKRAYMTAKLICSPFAAEEENNSSKETLPDRVINTDERITELCFGEFEGRKVDEMLNDSDCAFRYFKSDPKRYNAEISRLNTPETLTAMLERTAGFIQEMIEPLVPAEANELSDILISGHGAVNRALLMYFSGKNDLSDFWGNGLQPNCGITKISCTRSDSGKILYHVQDECMVFYDISLEKGLKKLL
ncbi:MAG: histidine phosphatase family protein [Lachnospiraceae bacterium]|nr:histidine phosphatase family protein [Lachnospiraceae bacterium]